MQGIVWAAAAAVVILATGVSTACHSTNLTARGVEFGSEGALLAEFRPMYICQGEIGASLIEHGLAGEERRVVYLHVEIIEPEVRCLYDTCGWTHGEAVLGRFEMTGDGVSLMGVVEYFGQAWQAIGTIDGRVSAFEYQYAY